MPWLAKAPWKGVLPLGGVADQLGVGRAGERGVAGLDPLVGRGLARVGALDRVVAGAVVEAGVVAVVGDGGWRWSAEVAPLNSKT